MESLNLKIMSFNIRYAGAPDGEQRWEKRKKLVVDRIQQFSPDLLGIQECQDNHQAAYLQDRLPGYSWVGRRREGEAHIALEMTPILYRTARFKAICSGHFWLSETPGVPGSKSWGSALPRITTWIELHARKTEGLSFLFFNTHFDHESSLAQVQSARLLRKKIRSLAGSSPVILTGDFNVPRHTRPFQILLETPETRVPGLADSFRSFKDNHRKPLGSFHGFGTVDPPVFIDWILISTTFTVLHADIDMHDSPLYPSDHYPVLAVVQPPDAALSAV